MFTRLCLVEWTAPIIIVNLEVCRSFEKDNAALAITYLLQAACGQPPKKRHRKCTKDFQETLFNPCVQGSKQTISVEEFLNDTGHNIRLKLHCYFVTEVCDTNVKNIGINVYFVSEMRDINVKCINVECSLFQI